MDTPEVTKHILIARVSHEDQRDALPAQKLQLNRHAEDDHIAFTYNEFDETASKDDRRKFAELVRMIEQETEYVAVCFDKVDRFSRDIFQEEVRTLVKLVRAGRIELHFPGDNFVYHQRSPASDRTRLGIGLVFAEYYSAAISDNVRRRFKQLLNDGCWPHKAPLGYINVRIDEKHTTVEVEPVSAKYIVKAFKLRSVGLPYEVIAKRLAEEGFRSKNGNVIGKSYMEKLMNDKFYCGVMTHDGREYPHRYEPLISLALFNKCQEVKKQRGHDMTKYNSGQFTLKQLPKCGRCGRAISSYATKNIVYLRCAASGKESCGNPNAAESLFIPGIEEDLSYCIMPPDKIQEVIGELKKRHENQQLYYSGSIEANRKEYDSLKKKLSTLYMYRLDGRISAEQYDELAKQLEGRQQELADQLKLLTADNKSFLVTESYLLDLCQRAVELFRRSNPALRQELLSFMLSNITLNDKKLTYDITSPFGEIVCANKKAQGGPLRPDSEIWQGKRDSNFSKLS